MARNRKGGRYLIGFDKNKKGEQKASPQLAPQPEQKPKKKTEDKI